MRYIKTYEGFFSKVKTLFKKEEPVPDKVINVDEVESLLKDCFLELEDNGFNVKIETSHQNMRSDSTGNVYFTEKIVNKFIVYIDKPKDKRELIYWQTPSNEVYVDFEINQVRDSILFSIDIIQLLIVIIEIEFI